MKINPIFVTFEELSDFQVKLINSVNCAYLSQIAKFDLDEYMNFTANTTMAAIHENQSKQIPDNSNEGGDERNMMLNLNTPPGFENIPRPGPLTLTEALQEATDIMRSLPITERLEYVQTKIGILTSESTTLGCSIRANLRDHVGELTKMKLVIEKEIERCERVFKKCNDHDGNIEFAGRLFNITVNEFSELWMNLESRLAQSEAEKNDLKRELNELRAKSTRSRRDSSSEDDYDSINVFQPAKRSKMSSDDKLSYPLLDFVPVKNAPSQTSTSSTLSRPCSNIDIREIEKIPPLYRDISEIRALESANREKETQHVETPKDQKTEFYDLKEMTDLWSKEVEDEERYWRELEQERKKLCQQVAGDQHRVDEIHRQLRAMRQEHDERERLRELGLQKNISPGLQDRIVAAQQATLEREKAAKQRREAEEAAKKGKMSIASTSKTPDSSSSSTPRENVPFTATRLAADRSKFMIRYTLLNGRIKEIVVPEYRDSGYPLLDVDTLTDVVPNVFLIKFTYGPGLIDEGRFKHVHVDMYCEHSYVASTVVHFKDLEKTMPPYKISVGWGNYKHLEATETLETFFTTPKHEELELRVSLKVIDLKKYPYFDRQRMCLGLDFVRQYIYSKRGPSTKNGQLLISNIVYDDLYEIPYTEKTTSR